MDHGIAEPQAIYLRQVQRTAAPFLHVLSAHQFGWQRRMGIPKGNCGGLQLRRGEQQARPFYAFTLKPRIINRDRIVSHGAQTIACIIAIILARGL